MKHIAIDLGGRESQICVRSENGDILEETRQSTRSLERFLKRQPPSRVVVETCAEAFGVADRAIACGHQVSVVPAHLVKSLGVGARKTKTDKKDAQVLSQVSCRIDLPSVHIPSPKARQRKTMSGMREQLLGARTQLINCVRGWLRGSAIRVKTGATSSFPSRVRRSHSDVPEFVDRLLVTIDHLSVQIKAADKELNAIVKDDPLLQRLMTVPGVGPVTAIRFTAALDDVTRFPNAHSVQSYLGLVPGERQSSDRRHRLGITKAGSSAARRALVQAAWSARRVASLHSMGLWASEVEKRRGKFVAVVALARKLSGILYALWRDSSTYVASRAAG